MGLYISYADFQGAYSFAVHNDLVAKAEDEITLYEKMYLIRIFGEAQYNDMAANKVNYTDLEDVIVSDTEKISRGLKTCLLGLVFFDLNRNLNFVGTSSGTKRVAQDLEKSDNLLQLVNRHYNDSLKDADVMQWACENAPLTYPFYAGAVLPVYQSIII